MGLERRGCASSRKNGSQPGDWEELDFFFCVGLKPRGFKRMAGRSRMNREVHVRNWGGLEVKFLRSTRLCNLVKIVIFHDITVFKGELISKWFQIISAWIFLTLDVILNIWTLACTHLKLIVNTKNFLSAPPVHFWTDSRLLSSLFAEIDTGIPQTYPNNFCGNQNGEISQVLHAYLPIEPQFSIGRKMLSTPDR